MNYSVSILFLRVAHLCKYCLLLITIVFDPKIMDKSPWDSNTVFSAISGFPHKKSPSFSEFSSSSFLLNKVDTWKNCGYSRKTLFVGWGEGWACVNWKTLQKCKCPKNFVHDCSHRCFPPWNDFWRRTAEIQYWWHVTTQIWVVLLIGWKFVSFNQKH